MSFPLVTGNLSFLILTRVEEEAVIKVTQLGGGSIAEAICILLVNVYIQLVKVNIRLVEAYEDAFVVVYTAESFKKRCSWTCSV